MIGAPFDPFCGGRGRANNSFESKGVHYYRPPVKADPIEDAERLAGAGGTTEPGSA